MMNVSSRNTLLQNICASFNREELRTACFTLGVDYESLEGEGKASVARELIMYLERRDVLMTSSSYVRETALGSFQIL